MNFKKSFLGLCALTLVLACTTEAQKQHSIKRDGVFSGPYKISINPEQFSEATEESDVAAKFLLSILSPMKITADFRPSGYVVFDGAYGLLDFDNIQTGSDKDSVPFKVIEDRLYIDEIEINSDDYIKFKTLDHRKIMLYADSLELILSPIQPE